MSKLVWGVVSMAVGLAAGSWLELSARQMVFLAVLVGGVYLLVLVRRLGWAARGQPAGGSVSELLKGDDPLSAEEARQWLDSFLVEQQDKK